MNSMVVTDLKKIYAGLGIFMTLVLTACSGSDLNRMRGAANEPAEIVGEENAEEPSENTHKESGEEPAKPPEEKPDTTEAKPPVDSKEELPKEDPPAPNFDTAQVPEYEGNPYVEVNGGEPFFTEADLSAEPFESYSDLDSLGRCGPATACIDPQLMPTQERGVIGEVRPSGWHTEKYDIIPDLYLYNRCHLIAYQLTGENDNEKNLITGTRYLNIEGMLPLESEVADYVRNTGHRVLYRVTPCFEGDDLLALGVLIEARSVSSNDISRCVYCYNVQPGIEIDYTDGSSAQIRQELQSEADPKTVHTIQPVIDEVKPVEEKGTQEKVIPEGTTYVFNTNSMKFHKPNCDSVGDMKPKNTEYFDGTREEAIQKGYDPCKRCNP